MMNDTSPILAVLVLMEVVTPAQADWVAQQLTGQTIDARPSTEALRLNALVQASKEAVPW